MSAWDEHGVEGEGHDGAGDPAHDGDAVLEPAMDDVMHEDVEPSARRASSRGGVNPRLIAVLMMVVVIGGSGFAFMKMKTRSVNRADEIAISAEAPGPVSTDPVMQPGPMVASQQGHAGLLAPTGVGPAAQPAAAGGMVVMNPEAAGYAPGAATAAAVLGAEPSRVEEPPPAAGADLQVAALKEQIRNMGEDLTRLSNENAALQEEVGKARLAAKAAEQKQKTTPSDRGAAPVRQAKAPAEKSQAQGVEKKVVAGRKVAGKRGVPDEDVITEKRESRLANLSVRAIYPMNGRNARAWINVGDEVVEVSAGSTISGAYVKSVSPESMEVVTDAGVIRARR